MESPDIPPASEVAGGNRREEGLVGTEIAGESGERKQENENRILRWWVEGLLRLPTSAVKITQSNSWATVCSGSALPLLAAMKNVERKT